MADGSLGKIVDDLRLQAHFSWVLDLLRAQRTDAWDSARSARRAHTLALLEDYAARGRFPRNQIDPRQMLPVFIDAVGTTCAVAELMIRTGCGDLAQRVREAMNLAYVADMTSVGPELEQWAEEAGLSLEEVALVQPDYCEDYDGCSGCCVEAECTGDCECVPYTEPDGTECYSYPQYYDESTGACEDGQCVEVPPPQPEAIAEDGCVVSRGDLATGSAAPLFAALFLLLHRRRSARARPR
jgi:hypothetical protein